MTSETRLWFESALLPDGWAQGVRLQIRTGRIRSIERDTAAAEGDERHAVALPGLSNVHSHAFQRSMTGLTGKRSPGGDSFWSWRDVMYRFVAQLRPEDVGAIAAQAYVEMLESGFTRVGEFHYVHHDIDGQPYADVGELAAQVVAAAAETGIGLTLLPVFYAHAGFGDSPPRADQRRFVTDVESYARVLDATEGHARALPDAVVGVAPHSLRAVQPAELTAVTALRPGAPVHIHVAEQMREVEECVAWSGQRPVAWLLDHANVDGHWCLVHATHVDDDELRGIAARDAVVGLCPITEADLGDGLFPAPAFLASGGRIGIGSDSNVSIDAALELRVLEYGQRLLHRSRNVLALEPGKSTARALFDAALLGGAQACGTSAGATPGLVVGQSADLFSLDATHAVLAGRTRDALLESWIFGTRGGAIDRVWRHGHCVVRNGHHVARDAIQARFRSVVRRLGE